jgi:N-glycosylase/DNA lyase
VAQLVFACEGRSQLSLPDPQMHVMPGVRWGHVGVLFTPAYWAAQVWLAEIQGPRVTYRLGSTLREEVAACLLGGHGIRSEIAVAAFRRLRDRGLLSAPSPTFDKLVTALREPIKFNGYDVRYRFAQQRALHLSEVLAALDRDQPPNSDPHDFRAWFLSFRGIGPKTASWITRNWLGSDSVAIIDIHLYRAGVLAGFFAPNQSISERYYSLEASFLTFASRIGARAAVLDAVIWMQMRGARKAVVGALQRATAAPLDRQVDFIPVKRRHRPCQEEAEESSPPEGGRRTA